MDLSLELHNKETLFSLSSKVSASFGAGHQFPLTTASRWRGFFMPGDHMAATANPVVLKNDLRPGVGWAQGIVFSGHQPGDIAIVSLRRTFSGAQPYEALRELVPDDGEMTVEVDGEVSKTWGTGTYVLEIGYQRGDAAGVFLTSFQIAAKSTIINVGGAGDPLLAPGGEPIHLAVGANAGIIEISLTEGLRGKTGLGIEDIRSSDNGNGTASIFFDMTDGTSKEIIIKIGSLSLEFTGTAAFTATTAANLLASLDQVASVTATASATGAVVFTATLAASVTSQASVAAAISVLVTLAASGAGAAAVSAAILADANLSASAGGQASVAGAIANGWALGDFDFDFSGNRYMAQGDYYPAMPALLAALGGTGGTRASSATYTDRNGVLQTAAPDELRRDHDPVTLEPLGYLIEGEARTNVVPNNSFVGGVAGSPGAVPFGHTPTGAHPGLTRTLAFGTEDGIPYMDLSYVGTASANGSRVGFGAAVPATEGALWTASMFCKLVAGTAPRLELRVVTSASDETGLSIVPQAGILRASRYSRTRAIPTGASDVLLIARIDLAVGQAVDFTIRIGLPQLELGAYASSPIVTAGTAGTRAADIVPGLPHAQSGEHTLYAEARPLPGNVTRLQGVLSLDAAAAANSNKSQIRLITGQAQSLVTTSAVVQYAVALPSWTLFEKLVSVVGVNDCRFYDYGMQLGVTDTAAAVPPTDRLVIGGGGSHDNFMGHIKRVAVFSRKLSAAEVATL